MPDVSARPFLVGGLVHLGLGGAALLAAEIHPALGPSLVPLLVAAGGFSLLVLFGLDLFFFPGFVKREVANDIVPTAALAFLHAGLLAALAAWLLGIESLLRAGGILVGVGVVGILFLLAVSLGWGQPTRGGVPMPAATTPYRAWDQAAAASGLASFVGLAFAAALLAGGRSPWGLATLVALFVSFAVPALAAFFFHTLPRNLHAPPGGAVGAGALAVASGVGGILIAGALSNPFETGRLYDAGSLALAAGGTPLGLLLLFAPYGPDRPGRLLRRSRPLLTVSGAALAAGSLVVAWTTFAPGAALHAALAVPLLAAAVIAGTAGAAALGLPVALNAVPRAGLYAPAGSVTLALSTLLYAARLAGGPPILGLLGGVFAVATAGLLIALLEPLRTPRRECPPGEA